MLIIVGLRDLWMAIQVLWLAQYGYGPLPVHFVGKAGTALLMISIVGLIFADLGTSLIFPHSVAALAAGIWGIAMYWLAGYIYTKQGVGLLRKELGRVWRPGPRPRSHSPYPRRMSRGTTIRRVLPLSPRRGITSCAFPG